MFFESFLSGLTLWCFLPTGNYWRKVYCTTWHYGVSHRQETACEKFPVRHGTMVFHTGRKLFTKGFLLGVAPLCFIATGNCLRKVSSPTWHDGFSHRQETVGEKFPIRHDTNATHTDRILFPLLAYHESRSLLVGHDDHIADLYPFGLVCHEGNDIGNIFCLQCIYAFLCPALTAGQEVTCKITSLFIIQEQMGKSKCFLKVSCPA